MKIKVMHSYWKEWSIIQFAKIYTVQLSAYSNMRVWLCLFKETLSRDFWPSQSTPPRALIHGLKLFRIWLRIRRDIRFENRENRHFLLEFSFNIYVCYDFDNDLWLWLILSAVSSRIPLLIETAEAASVLTLRLLNPLPQSHWNHWIRFRGLIEAAESTSAVSLRPRKSNFSDIVLCWKLSFCSICFRSLIETLESASVVSLRPLNPLPQSHSDSGGQTFQTLFHA
jgi:hypothetical protein